MPAQRTVIFRCTLCDAHGAVLWCGDLSVPLRWDDQAHVAFKDPGALRAAVKQSNTTRCMHVLIPNDLWRGPWHAYLASRRIFTPFTQTERAGLVVTISRRREAPTVVVIPDSRDYAVNCRDALHPPVIMDRGAALGYDPDLAVDVQISDDASLFR